MSTTSVNQDRSIDRFDSDRAGQGAAVLHFDETCDLSGTASVPSEDPRILRYDRVGSVDPSYSASQYSVVDGACWWWDFQFSGGASAVLAAEIDGALRATSRSELNAALADTFIDEPL